MEQYKKVGNLKVRTDLSPEKQALVNQIAKNYVNQNKKIDAEKRKALSKLYTGAVLEIGSAAIPIGAGARLAGGAVKALVPYVGKKIATEIGTGLVGGGLSGATFGTGRGLMENKNPLTTAAYDAMLGAALGAGTGAVVGKVGKEIAKKNLKTFKDSNNYYSNYEQGKDINREDIGKIALSSGGFKETNRQSPKYFDKVIDLAKNLKKAKLGNIELPKNDHKYNIDYFNRLKGEDVDYLIAHNADTGRNFFHKVTDSKLTGPQPEAKSLSNNIINDSNKNFNPLEQYYNDYIKGLKDESKAIGQFRAEQQGTKFKNRDILFDSEFNPEIEELARNYFGTTGNRKEAGYILNDGTYLDMSGKKFGGSPNRRSLDHREITDAFLDNPANKNNLEVGFNEFIDNGAIRYMPETNSFFMSREPSESQINAIKNLLDYERGKSSIELVPNVSEWGSDNNFRRDYELWSDPKKIIEDIRTYYKGGKPSNFKKYN